MAPANRLSDNCHLNQPLAPQGFQRRKRKRATGIVVVAKP